MIDNIIVRSTWIETTVSNLIIAGILRPDEVAGYMARLCTFGNNRLARELAQSWLILQNHYEKDWCLN